MNRNEAIQTIKENVVKRFADKYNVEFKGRKKILLKDLTDQNITLYTIIVEKGYLPNYVSVMLYNGKRTTLSLVYNLINIKSEEAELEILNEK